MNQSSSDIPDDWIPPHISDGAQLISIQRNIELGMGSGSFRIPSISVTDLISSGYEKASLKPGSGLDLKTSDGSIAYSTRLGDASWIIIHHIKSAHTIDGIEYVDFEFWTDSKFYQN